jgi:hypothetical protein
LIHWETWHEIINCHRNRLVPEETETNLDESAVLTILYVASAGCPGRVMTRVCQDMPWQTVFGFRTFKSCDVRGGNRHTDESNAPFFLSG